MSIILFDPDYTRQLFPLTINKAVAELQTGMYTLKEWWENVSGLHSFILSRTYLARLYPACQNQESYTYINASVVPNAQLWRLIAQLNNNETLENEAGVLIACNTKKYFTAPDELYANTYKSIKTNATVIMQPVDLFLKNDSFIRAQFSLATQNRPSQQAPDNNILLNPKDIFIEEGCAISGAIINAREGPVYIAKNAVLMEGSCVRGPLFIGEGAVIKMGAKIYGATSIGKKCTVGGEIKNIVMHNYSNKAHDGYLGDSVIGSWCNLGAGTSCSNLKNTAGTIKLYDYASNSYINAGLKCGVIMGDYSRTAINTAINSGTSIGICCNLIAITLSEKLYKSFSWNGQDGFYKIDKAIEHIQNWMRFKNQQLTNEQSKVLYDIHDICSQT